MEDQKRPDGTVHGKDLPNKGNTTNVTQTYGGNMNTGYSHAPKPFDACSDKPTATTSINKQGK